MKKIFALALAAAMSLSLVACGGGNTSTPSTSGGQTTGSQSTTASTPTDTNGDGTILVGFAQVGHESDWRTASTKSAQDVFSAANGYELSFVDCDNDSAKQLEAVRSFIQQGMDYIVIDRTIDDSDKYVAWVGSDFKVEGLACGEWLKAYAADKGITEINANFECNPMAAPTVDEIIKTLQANGTPEKEVYVSEHWFAAEDNVKSITVNGEEQEVIHATQEVVDGRPY